VVSSLRGLDIMLVTQGAPSSADVLRQPKRNPARVLALIGCESCPSQSPTAKRRRRGGASLSLRRRWGEVPGLANGGDCSVPARVRGVGLSVMRPRVQEQRRASGDSDGTGAISILVRTATSAQSPGIFPNQIKSTLGPQVHL
jgi:hypothetical protein